MSNYIKHPLVKPDTIEQRLYQLDLAGKALSAPTLVVLPTGLGKTIVALLVIASRLEKTGGKALVLSPTKPLVEQHASFLKTALNIPEEEILTFTGAVSPEKRADLWEKGRIIISTPQVIENDILTKRISLEDVSHITFDEAHRAVGNYAYTYIAERYFQDAKDPHCLAITASPGSSDEKISEVCTNLFISSVAIKTESDSDVSPYIHKKEIEWKHVILPDEMKELKKLLDKVLDDRFKKLGELGYSLPYGKNSSKRDLLGLQKSLQGQLRGMADPAVFSALSILAEIMKVNHAVEIIETQGLESLSKYADRLENEAVSKSGSKAAKRLSEDLYMRQFYHRIKECDTEHPKLAVVRDIVSKELDGKPDSRVIIFTNYRDTSEMVTNTLSEIEGIRPVKFVGQSSKFRDKGLTQKQQVEIIEDFKAGKHNVLVATSVAEEGLDIPATDLVLFYEPVPSEIRSIQRKGRTGRKHEGRVVVLVTKGTRDEAYYWSCTHKERRMQSNMKQWQESMSSENSNEDIANEFGITQKQQTGLADFADVDNGITVVLDQREIRSTVARSLEKMGVNISVKTLEVGDYIVSDRTAIERKSAEDFVSSLLDRDLFRQISDLAGSYDKPILIIEGEGLFTSRMLNPNAIHGTIASLVLDFGVSVLYTRDPEDTASLISILAKREQIDEKREISVHGKKSSMLLSQQQEYVVSSISDIGPGAAKNLLAHFGNIENVMKADEDELTKVRNIGPKTAAKMREILTSEYKR
ncbi:DEAD/DEAH box helicase [Methanococcoides methylutens]|uniref:ATP-dependent RNA helicase, EIF-4A family n=1 Tax=Methanococcoides methylutens MM1 TaxID=1434104 RepID=A0A0E3SRF3_METMT|nr:DEAD/DEAH box helicase [Methanococcoides methylutens]AKB85481.1 ATP-dependent RNA helicase, EIF-4A family [Methanococcoides methylutens MM1]